MIAGPSTLDGERPAAVHDAPQSHSDASTQRITPLQRVISSCSGALITSLLVTPLDVVKVRAQMRQRRRRPAAGHAWVARPMGELYRRRTALLLHVACCARHAPALAHLHMLYVTPLDVVKVRVQAARRPPAAGTCFVCSNGLMDQLHVCVYEARAAAAAAAAGGQQRRTQPQCRPWYVRGGKFTGTLDAFVKIARTEGIASLWSGLPPTLVMAVPATVCYFTLYDNLHAALRNNAALVSAPSCAALVAGALARLSVLTIVSPMEMARTKMQSEQMSYRTFARSLVDSSARIGWRSTLFTGLVPTALRDVPFSALYWMAYERLKADLAKARLFDTGTAAGTLARSLCAGAAAGALAASATLPFDVCKTRRQVEIGEHMIDPNGHKRSPSTWACIKQLYRSEGPSALFKGLTPRVMRVAPACAIMIGSYEYGKEYFRHSNAAVDSST